MRLQLAAHIPRKAALLTAIYAVVWFVLLGCWLWFQQTPDMLRFLPYLEWGCFSLSVPVSIYWYRWAMWPKRRDSITVSTVLTGTYVLLWQFSVFATHELVWDVARAQLARFGTAGLFFIGLAWTVWIIERASQHYESLRPSGDGPDLGADLSVLIVLSLVFSPAILIWARRRLTPIRRVALVLLFFAGWHFLLIPVYAKMLTGLPNWQAYFDILGNYSSFVSLGLLLLTPLTWFIWRTERRWRKGRYAAALANSQTSPSAKSPWYLNDDNEGEYVWNPLDPNAWYYGHQSRRLNQSLTGLLSYSFCFMLAFFVFTHIGGCQELYEMPAGGGEQKTIAQTVKVQKVIKKKFVVNPFSAILFEVPPIDEVKLQLTEITKHMYKIGQGAGEGSGFASGTKRGKVRFIRLEYSGGDWDQDFGVGADLNMLLEYGIRTKHKVYKDTESRTIGQLKNFAMGKSPPVVYLTGQKNISLSKSEIKILKEYLLEKHGMIFGDNGGSRHFHNQFLSMMSKVVPNIRPVPVALDDIIHRVPYQIPFLPYVAPHGGSQALGWKVDGRWVCYYHPGDIGDAWTDDHSGVKPEIYEYCYQLGTNVIFYAHAEYSKWLEARKNTK